MCLACPDSKNNIKLIYIINYIMDYIQQYKNSESLVYYHDEDIMSPFCKDDHIDVDGVEEKKEPEEKKSLKDTHCIHNWLGREYEGSTDKCGDYCPRKNIDNCSYIDSYDVDSIVYSVLRKFTQRAKVGKEKYKTDLDRTDLNFLDWVNHAQEEMLDAALYLEKLKKVFENIPKH